MVKINLSIQPYENCPRFDKCQKNRCPLHPNYRKLKNDPTDPSQKNGRRKCVAKSIRKRIGLAFGLKNEGMTDREYSGAKKWAELPEDVKKQRIERLKGFSPLSRCISKGLSVSRKKTKQVQITQVKEINAPLTHPIKCNSNGDEVKK